MAVAAYVFDKAPAPPVLIKAWDYETYGVDVLALPIGELQAVKTAAYAHAALSGYKHATGRTVKWAEQNPEAWEFVAEVLAVRKDSHA